MASKNQSEYQTDPEKSNGGGANGASEERCPIEEVALVVPETDDPSIPVMTFRAWFLGITSCTLLILDRKSVV